MNKSKLPLPERLKKGAEFLGLYWMMLEERCPGGWSLEPCVCEPKKKFCKARVQWLTLAVEDLRDLEDGPYGLAMAMTAAEWDATGLVLRIQREDTGIFGVGTGKSAIATMVDMLKMTDSPGVLASTLRVMKAFPKSQVQAIEEPKISEPAVSGPEEAFE